MKDFLNKLIDSKQKKADELRASIQNAQTADECRALGDTLDAILAELQEAKDKLAELDKQGEDDGNGDGNDSAMNEEGRSFNPLATYSMRGANMENINNNIEERLGFAKYVTKGIVPEKRTANDTTIAGTAIPENLLNRIIEQIDALGFVLPLVTKTAYPVGQTIPTDSTKPTASWVNEGAGSTPFTKSNLGSIVFGAFKLRCEIRLTQEVTVQTISAFETLFVRQVAEAMVKAIEAKIISADDGDDCPTGILYRASGSDPTIEIAKQATGHLTYKTLCDAEALLPQQYEGGAKWFMSKKTFMQFVAMVDGNGQPIARVNYGIGGKPERTLLGRDVVLTGTYLADYSEASATADVCFAFLFDPSDYCLNTSYDLGITRKQDWDTEDHCIKAVMSVDGKVLTRQSLVKLVKKYN